MSVKKTTSNPFIPEIEKKIASILKELSLQPEISPQEFIKITSGIKHRYYSSCSRENKIYFFYALLKRDEKNKTKFIRELKIAKLLLKNKYVLAEYFPLYIDSSDLDSQCLWILTENIPSFVLEDKKRAEKSIRSLEKKEIQSLTQIIFDFNHHFLDSRIEKMIKIDQFKAEQEYKKLLKVLVSLKNNGIVDSQLLRKIQLFVLDNRRLLNYENKYFVHGDIHLGNIFIYKKGGEVKIKIIDWELYHLNNFAYDIAFFYSRLWRESKLRQTMLSEFLNIIPKGKTSIFKRLFKLNLIYFSTTYGIDSSPLEFNQEELSKRKQWFKKLLLHSVDDFEIYLKI